jgi:septation ring formation regulator EzrA
MTIEVTVLISVVSVSAAIYFGLKSGRRAQKKDDQQEAVDMTTVVIKLENIGNGINEIKSDLRNMREDVKDLREWKARTEESLKTMWKQLDELKGMASRWRRGGNDTEA